MNKNERKSHAAKILTDEVAGLLPGGGPFLSLCVILSLLA
jgi:hypothetical protein